jgi:hypothetical protein
VVPPDSHRISRARCYLGYNSEDSTFSCTGLSPSTATPSRGLPLTTLFSDFLLSRQRQLSRPTTPTTQRLPAITCNRFSLIRFRSPLLTESRLFSLPVGTEMFHFPTFPPHALCVQARVTPHDWCGVPPFGNPRINARLTAPRGLSQPPTSFIGSWCQGIHRAPLKTWPHKNPTTPPPEGSVAAGLHKLLLQESEDARVHCAVLNVRPVTPHTPPPAHTPPQGTWRYENRRALTEKNQPIDPEPGQTVRSLRTQQRAYEPNPTSRLRSTHPPKGMPYWEPATRAGRTGQRSTLEHHPRRSAATRGPGDRHGLGAALDHSPEESGQCSLERR